MTSKKSILVAVAAVAAFALTLTSRTADAAVTVIGSGDAQYCYEGAENGADPGNYIAYCNQALNSFLSVRDRAATYINRGVLRLGLNEANAALGDFDTGLGLDPALGEGYIDRGASLIEKKEYAEALASIDKGLALGARRPEFAYYDRAIANEGLGNIPAAYKDYQQALVVQPDFTLASDELKRFKVVRKTTGS
jgi:tetratricopeptide (TPR) repeat protein